MAIHSHILLMAVFAAFVSLVGGLLMRDTPPTQVRAGAAIFGSLLGVAFVVGWLLYFLPL
jgi:heme/copper-type cytochrome/quinol oxidase subunit 4